MLNESFVRCNTAGHLHPVVYPSHRLVHSPLVSLSAASAEQGNQQQVRSSGLQNCRLCIAAGQQHSRGTTKRLRPLDVHTADSAASSSNNTRHVADSVVLTVASAGGNASSYRRSSPATTEQAALQPSSVSAASTDTTWSASRSAGSSAAADGAVVGVVATPGRDADSRTDDNRVQESWQTLMRWSRWLQRRQDGLTALQRTNKVQMHSRPQGITFGHCKQQAASIAVFGGGSFGTAMAAALARQKDDLVVTIWLRDEAVCKAINEQHKNPKYFADYSLPPNVVATTDVAEAIRGAQYAVHAVPVQHSRAFLTSIKDILPGDVPIISLSKGVELGTKQLMHQLIPSALGRRQPTAFLSGPSFAKEVISGRPTALVVAAKDKKLARSIQELFASSSMRINRSRDVTGVEICGALKNVLAIAAGIVEGMGLGNNALAAVIAQGCMEIRWLAEKMGAKPTTISGLSGMGDIMLTCYGDLSRNRRVGICLGQGQQLEDILSGSSQVAEGVATAGVVVGLAREYRVSLPVLTAVAQILDGNIRPREAVMQIMALPQIEER